MQCRKSTQQSQLTSENEAHETPSKLVRSQRACSQRKQRFVVEEQVDHLNDRIQKLQIKVQSQKRDEVKMVLTFFVILVMGYIFISSSENSEIKSIKLHLKQLQSKEMQWKKQAAYFEKTLTSMRQELDTLHKNTEKIADQIVDIILNQLAKPLKKNYNFLVKYSKTLAFELSQLEMHIKKHYKQIGNQNKLRKITNDQVLAYSKEIIPENDIWYLQIKIQQTESGMISFGIFTQSKDTACGYCDSDKMFYIYARDGKIYHGYTLKMLKDSVESRFTSISKGDLVSLFIDIQNQQLVWYVNRKYAATHYLGKSLKQEKLHLFILMASRGDQIQIMNE